MSLLLGSGTAAAAGSDLRSPATRLDANRASASVALLPAGIRNPSDDDPSGTGAGAALPPPAPGPVTRALGARPSAEAPVRDEAPLPERPHASYRARAPPAA
ncbi:MAG TPA: hypothetical protein VF619_05120 [Allosphingosinicella sp.]